MALDLRVVSVLLFQLHGVIMQFQVFTVNIFLAIGHLILSRSKSGFSGGSLLSNAPEWQKAPMPGPSLSILFKSHAFLLAQQSVLLNSGHGPAKSP